MNEAASAVFHIGLTAYIYLQEFEFIGVKHQ